MIEQEYDGLTDACSEVAKRVLRRFGTTSSDLVETLGERYLTIAQEHQNFIRQVRESDDVIEHAVRYMASIRTLPPTSTDTAWFRDTLATLLELAVPNSDLSEPAGRFLPCLQEGIRTSLAELPVRRDSFRLDDEDTKTIERLQNAGCEHGAASALLDLVERLFHGDPIGDEDARLFYLAALSAPLTRRARLSTD